MFGTCYRESNQSVDAIVSHHPYLVLLHYLRKCSSLLLRVIAKNTGDVFLDTV